MLVKFEVYNDGEYWCVRGIGVDIFTHGKTLDELMDNIKEAVEVHFEEINARSISRELCVSSCQIRLA